MDWGDSLPLPDATIHCVAALHFSARGLLDRNRTLWCGYLIEAQGLLIYYAGDTGFGDSISPAIRERYGAPRLALLPIKEHTKPRWFMSPVHMAPEEAVSEPTGSWLLAQTSIAIHHGTLPTGR